VTAADPSILAFREVVDEGLDELRRGIADLSVEELNARPAGGDTNSIAVIVAHAVGSTKSWLSLATNAPLPPRDRDAEFVTVADEGFPAWAEEQFGACLALLADDVRWDPELVRTPVWSPRQAEEPRTAAYAVAHALEHLGEHVGHLHMTRELLRPSG
jgi:uncharacterized damage-inducible protein DinB